MDNFIRPNSLLELARVLHEQNISETEYRKHVAQHLENKARKRRIPLLGTFELTPLCNLDCKMCYIHLNKDQFCQQDLLPTQIWKSLIKQASEAGMLKAAITGGECLTYPGFDDIYTYLFNMGIYPTIMSNGILIDQERIDFFKQYPPDLLQITLYGSSDDAYEKVTGKRVFNIVYNNLIKIRESNLRIVLTLTPSKFMKDDIRPLVETASSLNIPFNINSSLITPRNNTGRRLEDLSLDQYIEIYQIRKELNNEILVSIDPVELPDENHTGNSKYGLQCGGGRSSFVIKYDGSMSPCPSLYEINSNPLVIGFNEAWKQINQMADNYPVPEECDECAYHDYCLLCPAVHRNANRIGHCDPKICERTKRLIREGFIKMRR